jgi:hypothetical protein
MVETNFQFFAPMLKVLVLGLLMTAGLPAVFALEVTVSGGHVFTIDQGDLAGGAGSNFIPVHQSAVDSVLITVAGTTGETDAWQLLVHKEDALWHGSLALGVLRTGTGSGSGSIGGGHVLSLILNASDQVFFEGSGDRATIPVQLTLSGVSVLIPVDSYTTTVYLTILDLP